MPFLNGDRQHVALERPIARVEGIDWHLHRVKVKSAIEHFEMDRRIFVAGEADEAHLALLFGGRERLQHSVGVVCLVGIVIVNDLVDLPHVEVVGLEAGERLLKHLHGNILLAAMCTNLGHDDRLVAFTLECGAHPLFAHAPVILPRVVKEVDAVIDCLGDHLVDFQLTGGGTEVIAAHSDDRHVEISASHRPLGYLKAGQR
jgi:hypothetical protein